MFEIGVRKWIERNQISLDDLLVSHTKYYCPKGCVDIDGLRKEVDRHDGSKFLKSI